MSKKHLQEFIGFGVAGNFAHHLVQAGEASDFVDVVTKGEDAPKGMFPFYLPKSDRFLGCYPLSSEIICYPQEIEEGNLQMEPEVALICEVLYDGDQVIDLIPNFFTAYNDCSIRKPNAKKISEKKNWGENTKGISSQIISIDRFEEGGVMDSYSIASFLKRDGVLHPYGEDSSVLTYNYFYTKLKNWMIEKLNTQEDFGPLEDLHTHLKNAGFPQGLIVSIGATSYTPFGESTFLARGDELFVVVYDTKTIDFAELQEAIRSGKKIIEKASILHQHII